MEHSPEAGAELREWPGVAKCLPCPVRDGEPVEQKPHRDEFGETTLRDRVLQTVGVCPQVADNSAPSG